MPEERPEKQPENPRALTHKQELFVQNLVQGKTRRAAYSAAYATGNMSMETLDVEAYRLFNKPHVHARYEQLHGRLLREAEEEAIASGKEVLRELQRIAFARAGDYTRLVSHEDTVRLEFVPTGQLGENAQAALAGYKQAANGTIEVKTHCKMRALEMLGRHFGLFAPAAEEPEQEGDNFTVEINVVE